MLTHKQRTFTRQNRRWIRTGCTVAVLALSAVALGQNQGEPMREVGWRLNKLAEMAGIWTFLAVLVVIKTSKVASALLVSALSPSVVQAARERIETSPGRMLALGFINAVAILLILAILPKGPAPVGLLKLLIILLTMLVLVVGMSGFYGWLGERFFKRPVGASRALLCGGAAWETATLLPLLGQLAQIIVLLMALGAGAQVLWSNKKKRVVGEETADATQPIQ